MKKSILILVMGFLFYQCSSSDDENIDNNEEVLQYISHFSTDSGGNSETLIYENNKLILRKEYVNDFLDYNHNYEYNNSNQLIKYTKIHSTSTNPLYKIQFEYYNDGSLKKRIYDYYNYPTRIETFTYYQDIIKVYEGEENEIRIYISNNNITHVEKKDYVSQLFYTYLEFEYNVENNVSTLREKLNLNEEFDTYYFTYDDNKNPFFIFDYQLPNNLSVKKLIGVISHLTFFSVYPNENDNYLIYFSKNNITSITKNSDIPIQFNYEYNDDDYPTLIDNINYSNSLLINY